MVILEWIIGIVILCFFVWWLYNAFLLEKRRMEAFVEKENRQTQLYERLLEKLEDLEDGETIT